MTDFRVEMRAYTSFAPCATNSRCSSSIVSAVRAPSVNRVPVLRTVSVNGLTDSETRKSGGAADSVFRTGDANAMAKITANTDIRKAKTGILILPVCVTRLGHGEPD